ncbi:MAG: large conductance mechanosensitive channel protein MscL [Burkholderiaceae bacterium]|nr:large conductance mechanosensitive channel protein MscL [Burkholderiaceae bacterium]
MVTEFKSFAMKGNVMDLAVGVIIGAAFGKIVDSLVGDIVMPVVSAILGGKIDFSSFLFALGEVPAGTPMTLDALKKAGVPVFAYGNFITIAINFVLLALVIFLMVRMINRWKRDEPAAPPAPPAPSPTESLLGEIRDLLKKA